jgi:DNA-3-methyladenine glycosylase
VHASEPKRLGQGFFARDTLVVARELLGKHLVRRVQGETLLARIVETEAYTGEDAACHAHANARRLREGHAPKGRSAVLFGEAGRSYVYFNYGMYWLFNVVTERVGVPGAVLVRAIEPLEGLEAMRRFRPRVKRDHELGNGPGKLALALSIGSEFNGEPLYASRELYVTEGGARVRAGEIATSPRVGISKAQELPWRFYLAGHPCVSKTR